MTELAELSTEQAAAVRRLHACLIEFAAALGDCGEAGLKPADALVRCGIEIPPFARPMVNSMIPHG